MKRVDNAKDFIERTSDLSGIGDGETDDFLWVDDEYGSDCERLAFRIDVCRVDGVEHVIQSGDLAVCVGDLFQVYIYIMLVRKKRERARGEWGE